MLVKTRYYLRLVPRDDNNPRQFIELLCSKWIAQRAFVSLSYGIWRNGLYKSLDLCKRQFDGTVTVINSCNMDRFKILEEKDGQTCFLSEDCQ